MLTGSSKEVPSIPKVWGGGRLTLASKPGHTFASRGELLKHPAVPERVHVQWHRDLLLAAHTSRAQGKTTFPSFPFHPGAGA